MLLSQCKWNAKLVFDFILESGCCWGREFNSFKKANASILEKLHKISHVQSNTTSLEEVNENFIQIKTKLKKNTLLELNLTCIAMKLELA